MILNLLSGFYLQGGESELLKVKGFKFGIGDVVVPINKEEAAFYLKEVIIDDIHIRDFMYTVIDIDGDRWQVSPLMIEKEFILKEGA